jgi:hypothetical protein
MGNAIAFLKLLRLLIAAIMYTYGYIQREQFEGHLRDIDEWAKKAGEGKLEDRLEGGSGVEDNYNRHT